MSDPKTSKPRRVNQADLARELDRTRSKLDDMRARLKEADEIIRAIREGEVDAFVVNDPQGERVFSMRSADLLYRRMVEEMREGAVALDGYGTIVYANSCFAGLMGVERASLLGSPIFAFVPAESRGFFESLTAENGVSRRAELVMRSASGDAVPAQVALNRIDVEGGPLFCVIVSDLAGERRREQLLTESRRKDEFLAMLAHELRNPIAPIRNAAHLIAESNPSEPLVRDATEVIQRQVVQLTRLVSDLLDIARITRGKIRLEMQTIDLAAAVLRGLETAQPAIADRGLALSVELPKTPLHVSGDGARLSQVVSNIMQNAAKFTPSGGSIWLSLVERGGEAELTIRDSGVGIKPELIDKIFEPFIQADTSLERAESGLGIGLALVHSLVTMHDGRVTASSEGPNRGSSFVVTLPLVAPAATRSQPGPSASQPKGARVARRVLVVDDNIDAAETLTLILKRLGHEVRMVHEGREVLEAAKAFKPEVILLDISLPDINGYDVAAELRRHGQLTGVFLAALTGYGQEDDRRRSREAGFDQHWVKPIDPALLDNLIASLPNRSEGS